MQLPFGRDDLSARNPLLREPLKPEHIKRRLLGHWGSDPGQSFTWVHLNRLIIRKYDLNVMFISGPGHGAPATLSNCYLEGITPRSIPTAARTKRACCKLLPAVLVSRRDRQPLHARDARARFTKAANWAIASRTRSAPRSTIPDLIVAAMVGDGEAETGPLATSWHSNKFLNPIRDGAVLPILHLNGYKIANPDDSRAHPARGTGSLFVGYGYTPYFVEGDDPAAMHQQMAATLEQCIVEIRAIQQEARANSDMPTRPRWPMIVLRSPKGWTGPRRSTATRSRVSGARTRCRSRSGDQSRAPEGARRAGCAATGPKNCSMQTAS